MTDSQKLVQTNELIEAAKRGDSGAVRKLLNEDPALAGARAESGETPVIAALYRGHKDVVNALIDAGAPLDIFAAAAVGREEVLQARLVERPASANEFAYDGWTPLHLAVFFGHTEAARLLLAAGAEMNARSRNSIGNTPLHAAVAGGHVEAALFLIDHGADVNARDAGEHTPLHIAAEAGYVPIAKALLARGADPHAVDAEDKTPLARAAARNQDAIVDLINVDR